MLRLLFRVFYTLWLLPIDWGVGLFFKEESMNLRHMSCLCIFLFYGSLAFANDNLVETMIPSCDYSRLTINVPSTIKLVANGESHGRVKGTQNELGSLTYACAEGDLKISTKAKFEVKNGFILELANGSISEITLNGDQKIEITELATQSFTLTANGSSKSLLLGQVANLKLSLNGSAEVDASTLESQRGKVIVNGSGLARLNVSTDLSARVNGSGHIEYLSEPNRLDTSINGGGSITLISKSE